VKNMSSKISWLVVIGFVAILSAGAEEQKFGFLNK